MGINRLSLDSFRMRLDSISQPDLTELTANLMWGYWKSELVRQDHFSGIKYRQDGAIATFTYSGVDLNHSPDPDLSYRFLFYRRMTVTAIPAFVKPIRAIEEMNALVDHMCSVGRSSIRSEKLILPRTENNYTDGGDHLYCLADLDEKNLRMYHNQNKSYMSKLRDDLGLEYAGIISFNKFADVYAKDNAVRDFCHGVFKKYTRFIFVQDDKKKLHITHLGLAGIVDSVNPHNKRDATVLSIGKSDRLSDNDLQTFEDMINSSKVREAQIQKFVENHPSIMNIFGDGLLMYPQLVLRREDMSILRPDFLLETISASKSVIIDLKLPTQRMVIEKKNRARFFSKVYEYIAQLREYGRYFESPSNRRWFRQNYGFEPFQPDLVLIVGKDYSRLDYELLNQLRATARPIQLKSYFEIIKQHKKNLKGRDEV